MEITINAIKYLLLIEFEVRTVKYGPSFFPSIYGPSAKRAGHKSTGKNEDPYFTVRTEENEVNKIFIISLESFWRPKQTLAGPYSEVRPAKLTNHSARTN